MRLRRVEVGVRGCTAVVNGNDLTMKILGKVSMICVNLDNDLNKTAIGRPWDCCLLSGFYLSKPKSGDGKYAVFVSSSQESCKAGCVRR